MCAAVISENRPRLTLSVTSSASLKEKLATVLDLQHEATVTSCLSPDIRSALFVPDFNGLESSVSEVKKIGNYLLIEELTASTGSVGSWRAIDIRSQQEFVCRVFPLAKYRDVLASYWQAGSHKHIADIAEIVLGSSHAYVFLCQSQEDLHSYVRRKRRLGESEAATLFRQIVSVVKHCHKRGVVLRDLKLRKFVFADEARTHLLLDGLEDAVLLDDVDNDTLTEKHGCPAYVSPEVLSSREYSSKAADVWSLGVILYTMLFGQYPFHDPVASQLFVKIRRGQYTVPVGVSAQARCLLRSLLRVEPKERLTVFEAARHPWLDASRSNQRGLMSVAGSLGTIAANRKLTSIGVKEFEQMVPELIREPQMTSVQLLEAAAGFL